MLLLSSSSLNGYGLHHIFHIVKKARYDGIDLSLSEIDFDNWDINYVKELIREIKVPILSITAPEKGLDEKQVDRILKLANEAGAQNITFSPPYIGDKNTSWYMDYLLQVKKKEHISISVQNVEAKFILFIIPKHKNAGLVEIKKVTGDTALDLTDLDSSSGQDALKSLKILGSSLKNIYISDKQGPNTGLLPGQAGGGTSHTPLESFLMKLKATGYSSLMTLKVKPSELGIGDEELVLQNLEYFKKYYKKHFGD